MSRPLGETSVVISGLRETKSKCLTVVEYAWVWAVLSRLRDSHLRQSAFEHYIGRLRSFLNSSSVYRVYNLSSRQLQIAAGTSLLASIISFLSHAMRSSALYQWLTAEPDPDVIVIDLRETWTVGPVLGVLDRLITVFLVAIPESLVGTYGQSAWRVFQTRPIRILSIVSVIAMAGVVITAGIGGSLTLQTLAIVIGALLFAVMGLRSNHTLAEIRETRIVTLLAAAFAPPEPPESRTDSTKQAIDAKTGRDDSSEPNK